MKEQLVFMGDFPLMTERGTFIINGSERVVVLSARSFTWRVLSSEMDNGVLFTSLSSFPHVVHGLSLRLISAATWSSLLTKRRQSATVFLRALGIAVTDDEILLALGDSDVSATHLSVMLQLHVRMLLSRFIVVSVQASHQLLTARCFDGSFLQRSSAMTLLVLVVIRSPKLEEEIPADVRLPKRILLQLFSIFLCSRR